MIERIAKIVCEKPWGLASRNQRQNAVITANAVLDEIETPDDAMLERAVKIAAATGIDMTTVQAHDIWQALVDEGRSLSPNHP